MARRKRTTTVRRSRRRRSNPNTSIMSSLESQAVSYLLARSGKYLQLFLPADFLTEIPAGLKGVALSAGGILLGSTFGVSPKQINDAWALLILSYGENFLDELALQLVEGTNSTPPPATEDYTRLPIGNSRRHLSEYNRTVRQPNYLSYRNIYARS